MRGDCASVGLYAYSLAAETIKVDKSRRSDAGVPGPQENAQPPMIRRRDGTVAGFSEDSCAITSVYQ